MTLTTLQRAAKASGYTVEQITGRDRHASLCRVRHAVMAEMRAKGLSLGTIGRLLHRDHTSVIHGLRAHERRATA